MRIKKIDDSFGDYKLEISYGQLIAIRDALTAAHAEPMADEILQEISFYLENVPGPGESKEEFEARETTGKDIENSASLPGEEGAPPEGAEDGFGRVPSAEGEDDFDSAPLPDDGAPPADDGSVPEEESPLPPPPADEGDEPRSTVPPAPEE